MTVVRENDIVGIFEIVVMVFVQPTNGEDFLRALELPVLKAIFPAVACLQR